MRRDGTGGWFWLAAESIRHLDQAIPVVRSDALERYPQLVRLLDDLENTMDEPAMIELNYLVDVQRRNVRDVVGEFLGRIWAD